MPFSDFPICHLADPFRREPFDKRIVHKVHPFAPDDRGNRIQSCPDPLLSLLRRRTDIGRTDIPVLDQTDLVRLFQHPRKRGRRAHCRIRHPDHDIRIGRLLERQQRSAVLTHRMHISAPQHTVRTGIIHIFHRAHMLPGILFDKVAAFALFAKPDQLARPQLPLVLHIDHRKRRAFACDHIAVIAARDPQRTDPVRRAHRIHRVLCHDHERIGTFQFRTRRHDLFKQMTRIKLDQMRDQLRVAAALKNKASLFHLVTQSLGIRDISGRRDREMALMGTHHDRLHIFQIRIFI